MFKRVCQIKNTYLLYFYFPLNYRGFSKSEGGQGRFPIADFFRLML